MVLAGGDPPLVGGGGSVAEQQEWVEVGGVRVEPRPSLPRVDSLVGADGRPEAGDGYVVTLVAATPEQAEVLREFGKLLNATSRDGGRKRAAGLKPSWKIDGSHRAAIFSHLNKYEHGERVDPDSGQHPFVHLAWRALAIAWQETNGVKGGDL